MPDTASTSAAPVSPDHIAIVQALDSLNVHSSPPPSLAARFGDQPTRSAPSRNRDEEGALHAFIQYLISQDHSDSDPNLLAIGYELEALLSIYPESVKLSISSRPASIDWSHLDAIPSARPSRDVSPAVTSRVPVESAHSGGAPESAEMEPRKSSSSWSEAVFESQFFTPGERIRYEVSIPVWEEGDDLDGKVDSGSMPAVPPKMRVLVSLPPTYPSSASPQLQLLGRYLGAFPIDAGLFGDITRTYISSSGVPFSPGDVCVFEGLTFVQTVARKWYIAHLSEGAEGERQREADRKQGRQGRAFAHADDPPSMPSSPLPSQIGFDPSSRVAPAPQEPKDQRPSPRATFSYTREAVSVQGSDTPQALKDAERGLEPFFRIFISQPIVDRKSTFVGHAIRVTDEREVPLVIYEILSDKKVAKAAHPAMFAYRIVKDVGGVAGKVIATDCDDDGETAAGSRLAHLLEILEVENVLVVVSRWYGGTLLGSDRFKHINQAARDALEVGGFLLDKESDGRDGKKGGRRR